MNPEHDDKLFRVLEDIRDEMRQHNEWVRQTQERSEKKWEEIQEEKRKRDRLIGLLIILGVGIAAIIYGALASSKVL